MGGEYYEKYNDVNKKFTNNEGKLAGDFHQPATFGKCFCSKSIKL